MPIKITEQNNRLLVRRWHYSKEHKRSMPSTVYSVACRKAPATLPNSVVKKHDVTEEERQQYADHMAAIKEKENRESIHRGLKYLKFSLERASQALDDPKMLEDFTLEEMEEASEIINEVKKKITKVKNAKKRKLAKKPKLTENVVTK